MYKGLNSKEFAKAVRIEAARILNRTKDSHIGGGYSSVDVLSVLYTEVLNISSDNLNDPNRDIFILSKGHIAATMYTVLAFAGILNREDLLHHVENGSNLAGHVRRDVVPGIEMSSGSLGHGAGVGAGMAYAKRCQGFQGKVYVLMGDGECNEGSVWEAAMLASRFQLSNLTLIVDRNQLQAYGRDEQVLNMGKLSEKFASFGMNALDVDGHNHDSLKAALMNDKAGFGTKPKVIIAHTIKGKGVSFMEDRLEWHFKSPNDEQLAQALKELEQG